MTKITDIIINIVLETGEEEVEMGRTCGKNGR